MILKPLLALGLSGILVLTVTGCANTTPNGNVDKAPTSSETEPVACSTEDSGPWGDVIPNKPIEDEFGEYCSVTLDPNSDALKFDIKKVNMDSMKAAGFTEEDAEKAQIAAVTFLIEQGLDSTVLDNDSKSDSDWLKTNKELISPQYMEYYTGSVKESSLSATGIIISNSIMPTPLKRTGEPRATAINVSVNNIFASAGEDGFGDKGVLVVLQTTATYETTDTAIVAAILKNDSTKTEESLKAEHPELFDGSDAAGVIIQGNVMYGYTKGNYKQITGATIEATVATTDGIFIAKTN